MCSALRCTSAVVLEYVQCSAEFLRLDRHGNSLGRDVLWTPETCACRWDRDLELCAMLSVALCSVRGRLFWNVRSALRFAAG